MHLQELSYSHIIKYYQTFKEEDNLYIINEYISNGDMSELIKTRRKLNKPFEEEELWNIFLQCIMTLYHIHKKGIIHRHIKPSNIFIDENMKIKIGDFGFLFLEPDKYNDQKIKYLKGPYISENSNMNTPNAQEIELNKHDQKIDVYALGMSFFEMAFFHKGELSENDKKLNYSETLKNIIFLMMEEDKDKRMTSEQIYEKIGIEYSRIAKNSSIDAMITCLNALNTLNQELKNKVESNKQFYQNKPIINVYLECIKFMQNKDIDFSQWEYNVNNFRKQLGLENLKFEGTKEIDPMILFEYIMKKLFEETNTIKHIEPNYNFGPHLINSDEGLKEIEENEARLKFDNLFEKFDSPIINNLKGLMRQTNTCSTCNIKTYKFSCYFYVNFNLEKILKKKKY
jgi:serine/threonine protein kinase